jgi:DNA-directed RNA polymerase beta' subunit
MKRSLNTTEIQDILNSLTREFYTIQNLPKQMADFLLEKISRDLKNELEQVEVYPEGIPKLKKIILNKYRLVEPSKSVGIICGQSIGEMSTQNTLNVFHSAGISNRLVVAGVPRFLEIIDTTRSETQGSPVAYIFFKNIPQTIQQVRQIVGSDLVSFTFKQLYSHYKFNQKNDYCITYTMNLEILFRYKITLNFIVSKLKHQNANINITCSALHLGIIEVYLDNIENIENLHSTILQSKICGIDRIENIFITRGNNEWYIETDGSNLEEILKLPFVDSFRTYSNDIWETYHLFGIEAVCGYIVEELTNLMPNIHKNHITLLADRMTLSGKLKSISRYTRKHESSSILSKVTFEETLSGFLRSALFRENDNIRGISASIICGCVPNVGTGMNELILKK